jgi:hypothetical protein
MSTLTVSMTEQRFAELQARAKQFGLTVEELALAGIEELLRQPDEIFRRALEYVLQKNAELYRRLAR